MSTPPVSATDFLDHLNMSADEGGPHAAELAVTLEAATDLVESHVGPMTVRTVTQIVSTRAGSLLLQLWPVVSITSITDPVGGVVDVSALQQYAGLIDMPYPGVSLTGGRHTIVYQAGRAPVPAALKLATLIVAKHLWETQRASGSLASSGRFGATGPEMVPNTSMGFALPNRAAELMGPYMQPGIA